MNWLKNQDWIKKFVKLSIHFIKYFYQALVEHLSKYKPTDTNETYESNNSVSVNKETENKIVASSVQIISYDWSQEQVVNYFKSKNVNDSIIENLMPCDGQLLEQLHQTLKFFHSILRADSKASLRDIVFFTSVLKQLFKGL